MSPEQLLELLFPLHGQNSQTEFQLQPDGTTPIAINVRSIDPVEHRNRGASRPGIRKYVNQKLGLFSLIQHLNIIVDPTIDATLSESDSIDSLVGNVEDNGSTRRFRQMRRSNSYMRTGGSGVNHRKNDPNLVAVDDTISATVGGSDVTIQPLANDQYNGAPTFEVKGVSSNFAGSYSVAGPIGGWDFTYSPPATGKGATMRVAYSLKANGNRGTAGARIVITLADAGPPGDFHGTITTYSNGYHTEDGRIILTITFDNLFGGVPQVGMKLHEGPYDSGLGPNYADVWPEDLSALSDYMDGHTSPVSKGITLSYDSQNDDGSWSGSITLDP